MLKDNLELICEMTLKDLILKLFSVVCVTVRLLLQKI